jgi:hypothetical protein
MLSGYFTLFSRVFKETKSIKEIHGRDTFVRTGNSQGNSRLGSNFGKENSDGNNSSDNSQNQLVFDFR